MCLFDQRVLRGQVRGTVFGGGDVRSEAVHEGCTCVDIGGAGCVEGLSDAKDGFGGLEEGVGVLEEKREWQA